VVSDKLRITDVYPSLDHIEYLCLALENSRNQSVQKLKLQVHEKLVLVNQNVHVWLASVEWFMGRRGLRCAHNLSVPPLFGSRKLQK